MVGSYWKVINIVCKKSLIRLLLFQGTNVMSLCDFANCNSAVSNKVTWMGVLVLTLAVFKLYYCYTSSNLVTRQCRHHITSLELKAHNETSYKQILKPCTYYYDKDC